MKLCFVFWDQPPVKWPYIKNSKFLPLISHQLPESFVSVPVQQTRQLHYVNPFKAAVHT